MRAIALALLAAALLTGCPAKKAPQSSEITLPIKVVATTGMVADLVQNVGGERVSVRALMGPGVDPHLYKASEGDVAALSDADIIFYNGLHLEAKLADILEHFEGKTTVAVAGSIPAEQLLDWENSGTYDPHVWFDVSIWMLALDRVTEAFVNFDPKRASEYQERGVLYRTKLEHLHSEIKGKAAGLPDEQRVIVTAHDAFRYFGRTYGFEVVGLQGISTEAQAGLADVQKLSKMIAERKIPAIFVESSVPKRNVEAVIQAVKARGWNVRAGGSLYSDAMGDEGTPEGTYIGMVRHNIDTIVAALKGSQSDVDSRKSEVAK